MLASCERGPAPVDIVASRQAADLDNAKIKVVLYSGGREVFQAAGNPELVEALRKLLAAKTGKWRSNLTSWAPTLLIHTPDMNLNLSDSQAVLNIRMHAGDKVFHQFIVPMTVSEYDEIAKTVLKAAP